MCNKLLREAPRPSGDLSESVNAMKTSRKQLHINKLTVDFDVNVRLKDNYDIPAIKQAIVEVGQITTSIAVELLKDGTYLVLQGNRRTIGGQELYADPNTPAGVKESLEKVDVNIYTDLSEEERLKVIFDQGSQKTISRTELVLACWRLSRQFFSEKQIAAIMYFSLAKYTGNEKKLLEVPSEPKARETFVQKWFHGTLGNFFLSALRMPDFVRDEFIKTHRAQDGLLPEGETVMVKLFIKTHRAQDGLLPEGETVMVKLSRERVTALSKAKTADEDEKVWDPEKAGPTFLALWDQYVKEDAGEAEKANGNKRPSVADIRQKADNYTSKVVRTALLASIGEPATNLLDLDAEATRLSKIKDACDVAWDNIKDAQIKELVGLIRSGKPSDIVAWLANK